MLTEGQVQSGIRAGNVRRILHGLVKPRTTHSFSTRGQNGEKDDVGEGGGGNGVVVVLQLLLYLLDGDGEETEKVRYAWVVGRDEIVVRNGDSGDEDNLRLVFGNAALFNTPSDWIHTDALALKHLVVRKIETLTGQCRTRVRAGTG